MSDGFYPVAQNYYVPDPSPNVFPVRQGDLLQAPEGPTDSKGRPWLACQMIHPSCEIVAKAEPPDLHVVRVIRLSAVSAKHQEAVLRGMSESETGPRVAWANTFFLPPVGNLSEPMFADFRQVARVARGQLAADRRVAALTHDARVYFIRRKLYWEQRWLLDLEDVFRLERGRIGPDPNFVGEKPAWAVE